MKKLFLILLFTSISFAQSSTMLLLFDGGYKNPETTLYLAGQTVSGEQATRIDNFVTMLKDSLGITSLSSKFDVMYLLANQNQALGLRNLVKRSHDATAVNSPTFTQWQGFAGANTKYLNTNYTPSSQGINYTLNSASFGIYSRTQVQDAYADMGGRTASNSEELFIGAFWTTNAFIARLNGSATGVSSNLYSGVTTGLFVVSRLNNTQISASKDGGAYTTVNSASTAPPAVNIVIGANNTGGTIEQYSIRQYSFVFLGAGLTATEVRKLTNCVEVYMDALSVGVIP